MYMPRRLVGMNRVLVRNARLALGDLNPSDLDDDQYLSFSEH